VRHRRVNSGVGIERAEINYRGGTMKKRLGRTSPIFWGVVLFLAALLVVVFILSRWTQFSCKDFLANFLAGLAVAALAFLFVELLFGFTKRREQETRATELARAFLDLEIVQNRNLIASSLTTWREGQCKGIELKQDGWIDLMKSAVFPMLSQHVIARLSHTYIALLELRHRLSLWQEGQIRQQDVIRWAEKTLNSLDTALKTLHE